MFRVIALCILFIADLIVHSNGNFLFTKDLLKESYGEVIFSSVAFRQGEITPSRQYPNDEYNTKEYWNKHWPEGKGQLTKVGIQEMYKLGKWYHERYGPLIEQGYRHDFLKEESSNYDNTIMSGQSFLAGFLPPKEDEKIADELGWQPIPVRQIPLDRDNMIATYGARCPRFRYEKEKVKEDKDGILSDIYAKNKIVFETIDRETGWDAKPSDVIVAVRHAHYLYGTLFEEVSHGLSLPDWAKDIYPDKLREAASLSFPLTFQTEQMKKIRAGALIGQIVHEMKLKSQGELHETFHIYSGHALTLAGLLLSLDLKGIEDYDATLPPYGASVFIELRKKENDYNVTISYRTSDDSPPKLLHLEGCGEICSLKKFEELTAHLVPEDWQKECTLTEEERKWLKEKLKEQGEEVQGVPSPEKETSESERVVE